MRVLITGSRGWIGSYTCKVAETRGHETIPFDRKVGHDVRNFDEVYEAVRAVDHVINLSGVLGTHELADTPQEAVDVNVTGSLNIIRACSAHKVGLTYIIMPEVNQSIYRATKQCARLLAESYQSMDGLRVSYVRGFNLFGPGQAYGGAHPQKILPTFATKAWTGEPLPVWGDGSLWTDLVHVDDVARMLVEAMAFGDGQVFDAGTGYRQTVREVAWKVIHHVNDACGLSGTIEHLEPRKGERRHRTESDVARGENWDLLGGWHPVFDPERFAEAIDSYRP